MWPQYQCGGTGFAGLGNGNVDVFVRPSDVVGSMNPNQFLLVVHLGWGMSPFNQLPVSRDAPMVGLFKNAFLGDQCLGGQADARFGHIPNTRIQLARGDRILAKFEDVPNDGNLYACYLSMLFHVITIS